MVFPAVLKYTREFAHLLILPSQVFVMDAFNETMGLAVMNAGVLTPSDAADAIKGWVRTVLLVVYCE